MLSLQKKPSEKKHHSDRCASPYKIDDRKKFTKNVKGHVENISKYA